ncbi:high affinity immunoglobulin alpha and immunoglobulin mu Fc receptor isoform X1 [Pteropus medius]|uniref:high affinity immunoglobulin alpha and immunoglobulin mu Fc receptor isoform X1 n=1 Tax=Pteropus vampyrus TaxID=132908 RepID=UPI00196A82E3|nr:high affinity immunoglobulin alpha and immunoglobulin mu Fc receptor isoform X1 [Pteropus giganteus]
MGGEAPAKPGEQKCFLQVTNQRAGWRMPILLILCLLQAVNSLRGPRLVSGKPGDTVTFQCHYNPSFINGLQRKYWCRLRPLTWLCPTVVSTNHYTHLHYGDRVALSDFPQNGFFVVTLSQLSPEDVGSYRCGIGNRNDVLFSSMNLTISAGPPSTIPGVIPASGELVRTSFGIASPATNRWTPGTTQTIGRQEAGWDRVGSTPGISKRTASAKRRRTPGTTGAVVADPVSQVESTIWATVSIPESPASAIRGMSNTTEGVWVWGARGSVTNSARASEEGREARTTEADRPREEAERVRTGLDADWMITGTSRPSTLVSEKWVWETLREARLVSKPQDLGSIEGTTPAAGVWTLGPTIIEMASMEGSTKGDLDSPTGDSGPQATPSQDLAAGPLRPPGTGFSMNRASPAEKVSWVLTPVSTVLFPLTLVAFVLLGKKLQRKRTSQETESATGITLIQMTRFLELTFQPDELPRMERKLLQDDSPHIHATMTVPERVSGP